MSLVRSFFDDGFLTAPCISLGRSDDGFAGGSFQDLKCERIASAGCMAGSCLDLKLIGCSRSDTRNEDAEYVRILKTAHLMCSSVPAVEIAHDRDTGRVRCECCEPGALDTFIFHGMSAETLINFVVDAEGKGLLILLAVVGRKTVAVLNRFDGSVICCNLIMIPELICLFPGDKAGIKAVVVRQFHRNSGLCALLVISVLLLQDNRDLCDIREKCLNQNAGRSIVCAEQAVRTVPVRINHRFNFRPVHHLVEFLVHRSLPPHYGFRRPLYGSCAADCAAHSGSGYLLNLRSRFRYF